ncbi:MAG: hypothetical protein JSS94_01510 [Bacteroidetes bacterium]|nr:hypothetical protein [Bacteroidota bacterium]
MITTSTPSLEVIFNDAFSYWKKTLLFQMLFSLLFFSILFTVVFFAANQFGIFEQYMEIFKNNQGDMAGLQQEMKTLVQSPGYMNMAWTLIATMVFLFPLNMGFFKIFRKIDLQEKVELQDLFSGYSGINFLIYISYYLFWNIVYNYTIPTIILGILWVMVTLFVAPLMFFENKKIWESIRIGFTVLKKHFLVVLVGVLASVIIKYSGILIFGIGIFFTFPFFNAMIYSMYKNIFTEATTADLP